MVWNVTRHRNRVHLGTVANLETMQVSVSRSTSGKLGGGTYDVGKRAEGREFSECGRHKMRAMLEE